MKTFVNVVLINFLFCIFGLHSPLFTSELKNLSFPEINSKNKLIASNNNVKTVITKGFGSTVDEASQNALKNALTTVVGTFIDAETRLEERTTIVNGIISESNNLKENINNYSQGSIKYFEILKTEERNGVFVVEAKVEVLK